MASDSLDKLPTDKTMMGHNDLEIVDKVFEKHTGTMNKVAGEFKDALIGGVLFALLSFPQVDSLIKRFIPMTENSIIFLLVFKVIVFILLFYVIKNFAFSQKSK